MADSPRIITLSISTLLFPRNFIRKEIPSRVAMTKTKSLNINLVSYFGIIVFPPREMAITRNCSSSLVAIAANSASFMSRRGESSSSLNTST